MPCLSVVAVVVARHLRHVQVHVVDRQPGTFARARGERLGEPSEVVATTASRRSTVTMPGMRRSALNVSIWRLKPPLMPRMSSFSCSSPSRLTVTMVCAGPRPAIRSTLRDDAVGEKAVGRKVQERQSPPAGHDRVEDLVDVRPQEDLAAGEVRPRDVRDSRGRRRRTSSVVSSSVGLRCQMLQVLQRYWHQ